MLIKFRVIAELRNLHHTQKPFKSLIIQQASGEKEQNRISEDDVLFTQLHKSSVVTSWEFKA